MSGRIAPDPDETIATTFIVRVIATPETGLGEDDLGDLREFVSDQCEEFARTLSQRGEWPGDGGVRVAWTIEP